MPANEELSPLFPIACPAPAPPLPTITDADVLDTNANMDSAAELLPLSAPGTDERYPPAPPPPPAPSTFAWAPLPPPPMTRYSTPKLRLKVVAPDSVALPVIVAEPDEALNDCEPEREPGSDVLCANADDAATASRVANAVRAAFVNGERAARHVCRDRTPGGVRQRAISCRTMVE